MQEKPLHLVGGGDNFFSLKRENLEKKIMKEIKNRLEKSNNYRKQVPFLFMFNIYV